MKEYVQPRKIAEIPARGATLTPRLFSHAARIGRPMTAPFDEPLAKDRGAESFSREEVRLANRNHGMALELMHHDITPTGMHYLLTHFDVPHIDQSAFRLSIGGLVATPMSLSLADIMDRPAKTMPVTLECAGNGRAVHEDRSRSMPWHHEAVGTSEWTGTPLAPLLEEAGIQKNAVEIAFTGADRGFDKAVEHNFGRSLTVEQAKDQNIMLVYAMNGQPLLPQHGAPLRLIVPGWYGMASVKWLEDIEVLDHAYEGFQQVETYRYRTSDDDTGVGVSQLRVKSLMVPPGLPDWYSRQRLVDSGKVRISGRAWSGGGAAISRVEFSCDGKNWTNAHLGARSGPFAWTPWSCDWQAEPGNHELLCRATDERGDTQPLTPPWDISGFGNNAVQRVPVTVR